MSSGGVTRKKRSNSQEHEEEKPKKAKKLSGEAIRTSRGAGTSRRHQHQLQNSSMEKRSNTTGCQFGVTKGDDQSTSSSVVFESNSPKLEVVDSLARSEASPERRPTASVVPALSSESSSSSLNKKPKRKVWDLESALLHVFSSGLWQ